MEGVVEVAGSRALVGVDVSETATVGSTTRVAAEEAVEELVAEVAVERSIVGVVVASAGGAEI